MATTFVCPKSIKALALRATKQDACGVHLGDEPFSRYQGLGFAKLTLTPDVEKGTEIKTKDAAGNICIHDRDLDRLLGFNAELMLCGIPLPLVELMLGVSLLPSVDGPNTVMVGGVLPDTKEGNDLDPVGLELWSKNADLTQCDDGLHYMQWALPKTDNWVNSGTIEFSEQALEFSLSGYVERNPNWTAAVAGEWPGLFEATIKAGGPLAWQAVDALPTPLNTCGYLAYAS